MESQRHSFRPKRMAEWELDQHQIQNIDERAEDLVKNEMVEINSTGLEGQTLIFIGHSFHDECIL